MRDDQFTKGARGEFRGDFSRDTFDPMRHFSRVLMQQGRVQLDADWNEQVSILLHYMRQLGADLMGPHGAPYPIDNLPTNRTIQDLNINFKIAPATDTPIQPDFAIYPGRYYVNGICCENEETENGEKLTFRNQHNGLFADKELVDNQYLVYLDVWERHLTCVEDDYMREKALGSADTATRAQIVWQVNVILKKTIEEKLSEALRENIDGMLTHYDFFLDKLKEIGETKPGTGLLKARAKKASAGETNPCLTAPEASYRGAENQLYRVEIHNSNKDDGKATFKWSRENGSVIFPITEEITDKTITLEHLGRDDRFGLQPGDWVEVLDDDVILRNEAHPLLQVTEIDRENLQVILNDTPKVTLKKSTDGQMEKHPYLRRWDQKNEPGVIPVIEGDGETNWILLEDGVEIQFYNLTLKDSPTETLATTSHVAGTMITVSRLSDKKSNSNLYQTGDYWLIPARTATRDVEWPGPVGNPDPLPPQGVEHHYAPLAIITVIDKGKIEKVTELRRQLKQGWS